VIGRPERQRGAVTLIGALFIIVVISLMGLAVNRMAASNITDTSLQNDAVEALFVAESGIEYASFQYANGTACAALPAAINDTLVGRGRFRVTDAFLAGTDCRISVQGRVSSVAAMAAQRASRTLMADLRLASDDGWAVGDKGTILRWDGANWTNVESGTTQRFNDVYCAAPNNCWAVGDGVVAGWDGTRWNVQTSGAINLSAVACEPGNPNYCLAVGNWFGFLGIIFRWNGAGWGFVGFGFGQSYLDVACPSRICYVTAASGRISRYDGLLLTLLDDNSGTTRSMNGIACTSLDNCWAVGDRSGNDFVFNRRSVGGWSGTTLTNKNDRGNLLAVSCADTNNCQAVGKKRQQNFTLVDFDGTNWRAEPLHDKTHRDDLNAVHCVTVADCWAVGKSKKGWGIVHYDGNAWAYRGSSATNPENLNGVYLSRSGGGSGVTLVRWTEVIAN